MDKQKNKIIFDSSCIQRFSEETNFSSVIASLSKNLINKDLVTEGYVEAVQEREKTFPTGLPTEPIGVAIPHTDPKYVKENSISLALLAKPIKMKVMASQDEYTNVSIIFLLSLGESNKQLNILQKIMNIVQNKELLAQLMLLTNEEIGMEINKEILEG